MGWQTLLVTCCTCFLAGSTFHHWIVDHDTFWKNPTTTPATLSAIRYYTLLGSVRHTPLPYIWAVPAGVAALTMAWRTVRGIMDRSADKVGGGYLFDAACCLLLIRVILTQTTEVFPSVLHISDTPFDPSKPSSARDYNKLELLVKKLAGTNLTISVLLTGVILLQAGKFYSERSAAKKRLEDVPAVPAQSTTSNTSTSSTTATPSAAPVRSPSSGKKIKRRAATPYRELSEDEALELKTAEG